MTQPEPHQQNLIPLSRDERKLMTDELLEHEADWENLQQEIDCRAKACKEMRAKQGEIRTKIIHLVDALKDDE